MNGTARNMLVRLNVGIAFASLCLSHGVLAEPQEWLAVESSSWVSMFFASQVNIARMDREEGLSAPPFRNTETLPVTIYSRAMGPLGDVEVSLDVSGLETLYIGSGRHTRVLRAKLLTPAGEEVPLVEDEGLSVPYELTNEEGQFNLRKQHFELHSNEIVLHLGGKYKRLEASVYCNDACVTWLDREARFEAYGRLFSRQAWLRDEIRRQLNRLCPGEDERRLVDREISQVWPYMPLCPDGVLSPDAALVFADKLEERHKWIDAPIREQIRVQAGRTRTVDDFEALIRLSYAALNCRELQNVRREADQAKQHCPGAVTAFKVLEDEYLACAPETDYRQEMMERLHDFHKVLKKAKDVATLVGVSEATIDYVHRVKPVPDAVRQQLRRLSAELEDSKDDLRGYLAAGEAIRKLRRRVIFSHPALAFEEILLNQVPPPAYSHNGDQHLGRHSRPGPGLTVLTDWKSDHPKATPILAGKLPTGSVRNPDLNYDGDKVVFAFCDHTRPGQKRFFLYESAIDGAWVRQLTGTERDPFATWNGRATVLIEDNDPCYLPDGDLVFISTRSQSFGRCHGGRYNPAWVLHRCDPNGDNITQLSFNNENEYEPSILNDGRIVFTRWEYTNRHEMLFHMLWSCRPDGSAISHYYGNDTLHPMMVVEARAIPGTHRIVATAQGHHSYNTGTTVILDTNRGENGEEPVTHITPETPYSETRGWPEPHYSHPFPITDELFLVSRANHQVHSQGRTPPVADRGIYLVDPVGGRELIYENPEVATFSPIVIRKRKRPRVLPSMVSKAAPDYGTVLVQNAYLTRNDPEGIIKPGMIKAIRVNAIGVQPRSRRSACSMTVPVEIPKKVLGTVPVREDGSAFFKVPARTSIQLQILDENGMALLTEKSFFYLQPGENRTCVGCHEPEGTAPVTAGAADRARQQPMDLMPSAGPQYEGGLSFMRTVQPVLDRYCIGCHGLGKTEKDVNLVLDKAQFPQSLIEIVNRGEHRVGLKSYMGNDLNISRPRRFFAYRNTVAHLLLENHGKVNMDRDSYMRVIEWLDLNAQCFGDLFPNKIEERRIDPKALAELRQAVKEKLGDTIAQQPEAALINVAQPDESRILMAPLATEAGGWGQIDGWQSRDDPGYLEIAGLIEKAIVRRSTENTNGWKPTLECGGGDGWVMKEREQYLTLVRDRVDTEKH